jgi:hypothetical protein
LKQKEMRLCRSRPVGPNLPWPVLTKNPSSQLLGGSGR